MNYIQNSKGVLVMAVGAPGSPVRLALQLLQELKITGCLIMEEPCNCGNVILHHDGGNYHDFVSYKYDNEKFFVKYDTTCILESAEWLEIIEQQVIAQLEKDLAKGWIIN